MPKKLPKHVELKDLVGEHILTACDMSTQKVKETYGSDYEDCEAINFTLDGITYTAIEDPSDGYRSTMKEIFISDYKIRNSFPGERVVARMKVEGNADILQLISIKTGEIVLEVGTDNMDDYYPMWVGRFIPSGMSLNNQYPDKTKSEIMRLWLKNAKNNKVVSR